MTIHQKRRAQILEQPVANISGIRCFCEIAQQDNELVAAFPCKRVDFPDGLVQPIADQLEKSISTFVTQTVIDRLEAIEVDPANSKQLALATGDGHRLPQAAFQQEPIGQPGQAVELRTMDDLLVKLTVL